MIMTSVEERTHIRKRYHSTDAPSSRNSVSLHFGEPRCILSQYEMGIVIQVAPVLMINRRRIRFRIERDQSDIPRPQVG